MYIHVYIFFPLDPISYGRTEDRFITSEPEYLSYPKSVIVTVLAKQASEDSDGQEMWLAEVSAYNVC